VPKVLATDIAWPDIAVERSVLQPAGVEIVLADPGDEASLIEAARDADGILTCFRTVSPAVLEAATRCVTVGRYGVGVDNIAVDAATALGMVVSNVPDYCSEEVADHALLFLLAWSRQLLPLAEDVRAGGWDGSAADRSVRLRNRVLGLVGFGRTAQALAVRARAVGLDIVVTGTRRPLEGFGVRRVETLDELLAVSDVVSLHVPLSDATQRLIAAPQLARMKRDALLINTARGGLVDTDALVEALEAGRIGAASLDVLDPEPLPTDHPLRRMRQVVITPHTAFKSDGSLAELARTAAENVLAALQGRIPPTVVNPGVLDSNLLRIGR
jgi:D-3-phosphoglycerate dehydrogenase / 2-oxoglutarate reductase